MFYKPNTNVKIKHRVKWYAFKYYSWLNLKTGWLCILHIEKNVIQSINRLGSVIYVALGFSTLKLLRKPNNKDDSLHHICEKSIIFLNGILYFLENGRVCGQVSSTSSKVSLWSYNELHTQILFIYTQFHSTPLNVVCVGILRAPVLKTALIGWMLVEILA